MNVRYVNTDLEIVAGFDLHPLIEALEVQGLFTLLWGEDGQRWNATFETSPDYGEVGQSLEVLVSAIEALTHEARRLWDGCESRLLDIGYQCGSTGAAVQSLVPAAMLARVVALGADLKITLYPCE